MLHSINDLPELQRVHSLSEGYLINHNSDVNHGGRDVVHVLPLKPDCKGQAMEPSKNYPKSYTPNRSDLNLLGVRGQDWEFGECCKGRS